MRLIDAEQFDVVVLKGVTKDFSDGVEYMLEQIDDSPTVDAVEVVRCRDCKHFTGGKAIGECYLNPDKPIIPVFYNHFCSYGERRDDSGSGA